MYYRCYNHEKINNCINPLNIYSEHAPLLCSFMPEIGKSPSLKLFVSTIIDDAETVSADLRRANVGDMKKINNMSIP